jgi:hypothetical protein
MNAIQEWGRGFYRLLGTYYTNWTLVAFSSLQLGYLHPCFTKSVYLMLTTTSVAGLYITYVYPRKIVLKNKFPVDIVLEGWLLQGGDFLTHQLPLIYFVSSTSAGEGSRIPYLIVTAFWFLGNDPREQYHVRSKDVGIIFVVVLLVFGFS